MFLGKTSYFLLVLFRISLLIVESNLVFVWEAERPLRCKTILAFVMVALVRRGYRLVHTKSDDATPYSRMYWIKA